MKVLAVSLTVLCCFFSFILAAETSTKKSVEAYDNKEKRGAVTAAASYATAKPATVSSADVAYATAKVVPGVSKVRYSQPAQLQYVSQPQHLLHYSQLEQQPQQQHQYYYEQQQPVATAVKYASAAPAKLAYTAAQQSPNHIPYSLASDVSSFSYSSPLVAYNSLGLLTQHLGKVPATQTAQHHQSQAHQQIAYHQPQAVAAKQQSVQVAYQQPHVAYQALAQPAGGKVAATYVVAAQPSQYQHGAQVQQVAYAAQQQQPHYTYTQIPQQHSSRAHSQQEYSNEPQYIAVPAHQAPQQQIYYQQASPAPQTHHITREQYAQILQAAQQHQQQQQAHAQQSQQVQYQQAEPAQQQYSREYTVSAGTGQPQYSREYTVSAGAGQHSAPQVAYSTAPEYYREQGQYVQGYQQQQSGKYGGGGQVGIHYA